VQPVHESRGRNPSPWAGIVAAGYLAIQVAIPLWGLFADPFESDGAFSWNMYSSLHGCHAFYALRATDGRESTVDARALFRDPGRYASVFRAGTLREFHAWICGSLARSGRPGSLRARVSCESDRAGAAELVDDVPDLCRAPDYGVVVRRDGR